MGGRVLAGVDASNLNPESDLMGFEADAAEVTSIEALTFGS
jgi:hypothetical protein